MPGKLYCDQTTPWQGVYFFTNTVKVGAVSLTYALLCCNSCGWHHDWLCFHENTAYTSKIG